MCTICSGIPEMSHHINETHKNTERMVFAVPSMSCGSCVAKIERTLGKIEGIVSVRANLTLKRVIVHLKPSVDEHGIVKTLQELAFDAYRIDKETQTDTEHTGKAQHLLKAMAVAGFGMANIMLLSVSAWAGAEGATRDLFHFISALIAVPVVGYAGQPFFRPALKALFKGHVTMDVPISLAVILATGMSIFQSFIGETEAYFDAAVMLLFFLLIGRYLDQLVRARARSAVVSLSQYAAKEAIVLKDDGHTTLIATNAIVPGMILRIHAGARVPADGTIIAGNSELDRSMVTGENEPVAMGQQDTIEAGALNLTGAIDMRVDKPADQSFLAEVTKMLEAAEQGKSQYVRIADRAAQIYTPIVHLLALSAFIGWMIISAGDWHYSLLIAISVLIITCPCALGLAVPVAHVVAASKLFNNGLLVRNGAAIERLAKVRTALFDKTGTLTSGIKHVTAIPELTKTQHQAFASLASQSSHPASMAIVKALSPFDHIPLHAVQEVPGTGIKALFENKKISLERGPKGTKMIYDGHQLGQVHFNETLRQGAKDCILALREMGIRSQILSGDNETAVKAVAEQINVPSYQFEQSPQDKLAHIQTNQAQLAESVLMVGDGINDGPSLAAADVSMAPSNAADVGRQAADLIMARNSLKIVPFAIKLARKTDRIVKQNFAIAAVYNCIAVPLAMLGWVTPLIAALAMSGSSIIVILNSLRLNDVQHLFAQPVKNEQQGAKKAPKSLEHAKT